MLLIATSLHQFSCPSLSLLLPAATFTQHVSLVTTAMRLLGHTPIAPRRLFQRLHGHSKQYGSDDEALQGLQHQKKMAPSLPDSATILHLHLCVSKGSSPDWPCTTRLTHSPVPSGAGSRSLLQTQTHT